MQAAAEDTLQGARARRRAGLRAWLLVLPLAAFIAVTFVAPLGAMLTRSVHMPVVAGVLPETLRLLDGWSGPSLPDEAVFRALGHELSAAREDRLLGRVASRVNRVQGGLRSVMTRTARRLRSVEASLGGGVATDGAGEAPVLQRTVSPTPWRDAMLDIDDALGGSSDLASDPARG